MINVGKLRSRVTIQSPVVQNVDGEAVTTWTDVDTVWAAIDRLSGKELERATKLSEEVNTKITMRYRQLGSAERLICGDLQFDIVAVIPDAIRSTLEVFTVLRRITTLSITATGGVVGSGEAIDQLISA